MRHPRRLLLGLLASPFVPIVRATTPGPTDVVDCPGSADVRLRFSLRSGNTMGGVFWSDGYSALPFLPTYPQISRCEPDGPMFWVSDRPGRPYQRNSAEGAERPKPLRDLSESEFLRAIDLGLGTNRERLLHLRVMAWWSANHACRPGLDGAPRLAKACTFEPGSASRANLVALADLLDESKPDEARLKADALRQLGAFPAALQLLGGLLDDKGWQSVAAQLAVRAHAGDAALFRLHR
jgi:hypothetical protein